MMDPEEDWRRGIEEAGRLAGWAGANLGQLEQVAVLLLATLREGRSLLACGNGGSALQAQHLVAELVGRFRRERRPLPALALSTDAGVVTGIGNDYGYDQVFARQVRALGRPGDLLLALSTSGNSANVLMACETAREVGIRTVGFCGGGGRLPGCVDAALSVPSHDTARIQECHLLLIHLLCERVDAELGSD